ncbi:hypothetical protein TIFTF001_034250 [Ficus carica]|uniref:Uncharacterized protein n=1 Tax=Ficus carica TaxID=3494 RepID=A0AA88E014_FICCA|nr:hypothetical protein TIFTF001_034250 [Ficus carica]
MRETRRFVACAGEEQRRWVADQSPMVWRMEFYRLTAFESTGTNGDDQRMVEAKIATRSNPISIEDCDFSRSP